MKVLHFTASLAFLLPGCLADGGSDVGVPPGVITGTVDYDGVAAGPGRPLALAVYRTFPPSRPPVRTALIDGYDFPVRFSFHGLSPGTYYVGASIDVDRADRRHAGMLNPALDPFGYAGEGAPVVLGATAGVGRLAIHMVDPP